MSFKPHIHLAFRFHGNFYHSYRGDTPDELGFGKDIRIIRHIISTLDIFNAVGVPVRGTWDFENYFSLETLMSQYCPDIIIDMQRRIHKGADEANLMSYNNGLVSAMTAIEFEAAIRLGISNDNGSGLRDLFGDGFYPMVRPQEMMFTPIHLKMYPACGIQAISLFYSAIPFNGFSNFVPKLSLLNRHNPITLEHPLVKGSMTLMPCYNTGDLLDHLSLRRWVKQLRCYQLSLEEPHDLLLLIDMDADDTFWVGFDVPLIGNHISTLNGLAELIDSVKNLDYIHFTTPGKYLDEHPPLMSLSINQDTADGSFDGMSSWSEKWSNQRVWSGLERARMMELQTRQLLSGTLSQKQSVIFREALELRLKICSTTHFGMSAPIMNRTRENTVNTLVNDLLAISARQLQDCMPAHKSGAFSLLDYKRGIDTTTIRYIPRPSKTLIRLPLADDQQLPSGIMRDNGETVSSVIYRNGDKTDLIFIEQFDPLQQHTYKFVSDLPYQQERESVSLSKNRMDNGRLHIEFDDKNYISKLVLDGRDYSTGQFFNSAICYAGKDYSVPHWCLIGEEALGCMGAKRFRGEVEINQTSTLTVEYEVLLASGLPYLYLTMHVQYPQTPDHCSPAKAERLQRQWDDRWQEVRPLELRPNLTSDLNQKLRIWKHNYCDHVSSYVLNYDTFSKNKNLDSINNHVTDAWVAVSDGNKGLLLAQTAAVNTSMAFCPMRLRHKDGKKSIYLNPFGSYSGEQYRYATRDTGLGRLLAVNMSASDHIRPYAPSYNGKAQTFRLLIAPYQGDCPPQDIQNDAAAFAYPYLVIGDDTGCVKERIG